MLQRASALFWFKGQVQNKGPWDYEQDKSGSYQAFGNFNYGATAAALGLNEEFVRRMAGRAQIEAGTSKPEWGSPWGASPFGDDPNDQAAIKSTIEHWRG